jgi:transcriptional antiterminator NusG
MKDPKWYMVRCATGKEEKAIENLKFELKHNNMDKYVKEIVCPKEKQYFMRNKKKIAREKIMFPGYFLINMIMSGELPRIIKSTNLVADIMGNDRGAEALKESEVQRIFGNVEKSKEEVEFFVGETVSITDGPFKTFSGKISELNTDKEKVKVDVLVFGVPTPVELSYLQIDKAV